jgi:hypothetical protein
MNKELMLIFEDWYYRLNVENKQLDAEPVINFQQIVTILRNMQELPYAVYQKWKRFLATETKRNELLQLLSEGEHRQLVRVLYQQSSPFILAYAEAIEFQKDKGVLQGKSSGNFRALKWQFIHAVLLEPQQQVFNKRYFVENVLQRLAAHHNLKTEELLDFFYHELLKKGFALPFDLIKVMDTLYIEKIKKHERKKNSDIEKSNVNRQSVEVNTKQLLLRYFGNDAGLVSMILALSKQHDFVRFIQPVLQVEAVLRRFIFQKYHITTNIKQLLSLLVYFSKEHHTMSQITILMKVITFLFSQLKNEKQQLDFERQILQLANDNSLLKEATILKSEWLQQAEVIENIEEIAEDADVQPTFIPNGGLILIAPFLPRLFSLLGLTEVAKFKDQEAQIRAVFLMQYAVFGTTEFPEHELQLNKLLSSLKIGIPIPRYIELTEEEVKTVDGMLTGAIQHWGKVKSIEGLREGFLQREGKLEAEDESYQLIMEEKSYDMLLDSLPWSFKTVKFSWMEKGINVKWR